MFGSMFIGLSGMDAYSNGLRQVSNNITNLNSLGYRSSSVGFSDLFRGNNSTGVSYTGKYRIGGSGVQLSDLRLDFSQGELRQTDRDLDLAMDGSGFLVLEKDGEYTYARTGSFEVNEEGYIVLAGTNYKLTILDGQRQPTSLSIDNYRANTPEATTTIKFADNLSSTATGYTIPDLQIFNASGEADNWTVSFEPGEKSSIGQWVVIVTNGSGEELGREKVNFEDGKIDPLTALFTFSDAEGGRSVLFDLSDNVTSFSSGEISTLRTSQIDGFGVGEITAVRVSGNGVLEIAYSNGKIHELGDVTIADFRDLQGLEQQSGGLFTYGNSSGAEFFSSTNDRTGSVLSGRLEASNVDLSKEFGDLILVQRGYQASSQIVSVSNDMIQQLFGIRGQG
jgi:flagellar hook protein FlgE